MRWPRPPLAAATIAALTFLGACSDGVAGPSVPVLVGQFGAADMAVELLATHAGIELSQPCGAYFAADRPARLGANGEFRVPGRSYRGLGIRTEDATLSGRTEVADGVETVTLTVVPDGPGASADLLVLTLRRSEHYAGPELPCQS